MSKDLKAELVGLTIDGKISNLCDRDTEVYLTIRNILRTSACRGNTDEFVQMSITGDYDANEAVFEILKMCDIGFRFTRFAGMEGWNFYWGHE
jgi:hypothetical protein